MVDKSVIESERVEIFLVFNYMKDRMVFILFGFSLVFGKGFCVVE